MFSTEGCNSNQMQQAKPANVEEANNGKSSNEVQIPSTEQKDASGDSVQE